MKKFAILALFALLACCALFWLARPRPHTDRRSLAAWTMDSQVAAGEWKIEIQTPPCDSYKNIQVIYPAFPGAPMSIECNLMTTGTR